MKMEKYYAGVDVGGTKVRVSLADREGIKIKLFQNVVLNGNNDVIPRQVDYLIRESCKRSDIEKDKIEGVGISTCSPFEKRGMYRVVVTPNLCGGLAKDRKRLSNNWKEIPLEERLKERYGYGDLKMENDCVSAVVAERIFGAGKGEDNLVYITWSTGIGGGAIVDGHLLRGKNGNASNIGHIYISEDGPVCGCGNRGDFESLCSGPSIARDYKEIAGDSGDNTNTGCVFSSYERGESKAGKIVERAARNFARGLASINSMLDTKLFVLGGSVFLNHEERLVPLIKEEFYKSFPALSMDVKIKRAKLTKIKNIKEKQKIINYLESMAPLSLVMPEDWIKDWQEKKPWKSVLEEIEL